MTDASEYLTVQAAAEVLNTSRRRIWQLTKSGELHTIPNPLDGRSKLIPKADVQRLIQFAGMTKKRAMARQDQAAAVEHPPVETDQCPASDSTQDEPPARPRPRTFGIYTGPVKVHSDEVEDYLRDHWKPDW